MCGFPGILGNDSPRHRVVKASWLHRRAIGRVDRNHAWQAIFGQCMHWIQSLCMVRGNPMQSFDDGRAVQIWGTNKCCEGQFLRRCSDETIGIDASRHFVTLSSTITNFARTGHFVSGWSASLHFCSSLLKSMPSNKPAFPHSCSCAGQSTGDGFPGSRFRLFQQSDVRGMEPECVRFSDELVKQMPRLMTL